MTFLIVSFMIMYFIIFIHAIEIQVTVKKGNFCYLKNIRFVEIFESKDFKIVSFSKFIF